VIRIDVDLTNPGQFFGCCGVYELAHCLWEGVRGGFQNGEFVLSDGNLRELLVELDHAEIKVLDVNDPSASPMEIGGRFGFRLDWWKPGAGETSLKPWAGTMLASRIAAAMKSDVLMSLDRGFFDDGHVVIDRDGKKVEPYYFDSRRGASALPLDIGFSTDALSIETIAFPATEFLSLVGLQRFRPKMVRPRLFRYRAWNGDPPLAIAALAAADAIPSPGRLFQFENSFRTDQRKHKAFSPAIPVSGGGNE
jgi:CRISPR-associated protein Csb3